MKDDVTDPLRTENNFTSKKINQEELDFLTKLRDQCLGYIGYRVWTEGETSSLQSAIETYNELQEKISKIWKSR